MLCINSFIFFMFRKSQKRFQNIYSDVHFVSNKSATVYLFQKLFAGTYATEIWQQKFAPSIFFLKS